MLPGGLWVSLVETAKTRFRSWRCRGAHLPLDKGYGVTVCTRCGKVTFNVAPVRHRVRPVRL